MKLKDQIQREIDLKTCPTRIVSLVPSQTELLVDLGLETSLVGITKFCVHPKQLRKTNKIVGGTKQVKLNKVKALKPDIILCNKEENTPEMVSQLELIATVHVSEILNIQDTLDLIDQYGKMFQVEEKANTIQFKITKELKSFQHFIADRPKFKVAYFIWKKPWMVVASNTFINSILELNNFENVFGDLKRYPIIELKKLEEKQPEVVMLSSEPFPFSTEHRDEICEEFPATKVIIVNGEYFSWYGSRLIKSFNYFRSLSQDFVD